jgi:hypothetical protein
LCSIFFLCIFVLSLSQFLYDYIGWSYQFLSAQFTLRMEDDLIGIVHYSFVYMPSCLNFVLFLFLFLEKKRHVNEYNMFRLHC